MDIEGSLSVLSMPTGISGTLCENGRSRINGDCGVIEGLKDEGTVGWGGEEGDNEAAMEE